MKGKNMSIFCKDTAHADPTEISYASIDEVESSHTDVVHIEPVEGGWLVFTDARDYEIWQGQL